MNKKTALLTLIKYTKLLPEEVKEKLQAKIDELNPEQIDSIGRFLALEKKTSLEKNQEVQASIDKIIEEVEKQKSK